jgi:ubiquinone/menaquinone biosynthesis C-methylase UbiE
MPEHDASAGADVTYFHAVDQAVDPQELIGFLTRAKSQPVLQALEERMLEELRLGPGFRVLDVGCGYGADALDISRRVEGGSVVGVDASHVMIDEAKRRTAGCGPELSFQLADATKLPFPDDTFDACRAEAVLEHLTDPGQAVTEMARVTRPAGRVVALDIDHGMTIVDHPDRRTTRLIADALADATGTGWAGRQLRRLFGQAGLEEVAVSTHTMLVPAAFFRLALAPQVARLQSAGTLDPETAQRWWAAFEPAIADWFTGGVTWFLAAGTVPSQRSHASA